MEQPATTCKLWACHGRLLALYRQSRIMQLALDLIEHSLLESACVGFGKRNGLCFSYDLLMPNFVNCLGSRGSVSGTGKNAGLC